MKLSELVEIHQPLLLEANDILTNDIINIERLLTQRLLNHTLQQDYKQTLGPLKLELEDLCTNILKRYSIDIKLSVTYTKTNNINKAKWKANNLNSIMNIPVVFDVAYTENDIKTLSNIISSKLLLIISKNYAGSDSNIKQFIKAYERIHRDNSIVKEFKIEFFKFLRKLLDDEYVEHEINAGILLLQQILQKYHISNKYVDIILRLIPYITNLLKQEPVKKLLYQFIEKYEPSQA